MKKNLLILLSCFYANYAFCQLTVNKEKTISTAAIYTAYRAASWGDITGTGKLDLVSEIYAPESQYLGVLRDLNGTPQFSPQNHMEKAKHNFYGSCLADLDSDGDLDLVTAGPNGSTFSPNNVYYWSATNSRFELVGSTNAIDSKVFYGNSVLVGDFTNDGKPDVFWVGLKSTAAMYLGINSTTSPDNITFSSINKLSNTISNVRTGNVSTDLGDFNKDGNLDIIMTDNGSYSDNYGGYYQLLLGNGDGTFTESIPTPGTDTYVPYALSTGDINKDGKSDFILARGKFQIPYATEVSLYTRNTDNTGFDQTTIFTSAEIPGNVKIEDLNKDSNPDIILQSQRGDKLSIFFNQGDGTFKNEADLSFTTDDKDMFFLHDIDNSGFKEIVMLARGKVSYFKIGFCPDAPTSKSTDFTYDATEKSISTESPENTSIVWYTSMDGDTKTTAPKARNAGVYKAYAASKDDQSDFESTTRSLVTLTINKAQLTISNAEVSDKTYDGIANATISGAVVNGIIAGDDAKLSNQTSGTFASKNVGNNISVSTNMKINGADAKNYTIIQPDLQANITQKKVTITSATADSKVYDGTTKTSISNARLNGTIVGDDVNIADNAIGLFDTKNVGKNINVLTKIELAGEDAKNYKIVQSNLEASITKKKITISAQADNKIYDGTHTAVISNATLNGIVAGDDVNLTNHTSGNFVSVNRGTHIAVNTSMEITGADAMNYSFNQPNLKAEIAACPIEIEADPITKFINDEDPELTYKIISGNLNPEDQITGLLSREQGERTGNYKIQIGTLTAGDNYSITFIPADFTINGTITGIEEITETEIAIYPVPAVHTLTVDSPVKITEIILLNSSGQVLKTTKPKNTKTSVNVSDLSSGYYILILKTDRETIKKTFVKI